MWKCVSKCLFQCGSSANTSEDDSDTQSCQHLQSANVNTCQVCEDQNHSPNPANENNYLQLLKNKVPLVTTEAEKNLAVSKLITDPHLIGDSTNSFCLPVVQERHQDLKAISSYTLINLIERAFDHLVESYKVIDCRYPYEFRGGHIDGAINVPSARHCSILLNQVKRNIDAEDGRRTNILILYSEHSRLRGPKICHMLRYIDRELNKVAYPFLNYPEIYLLDGGYKDFYFKAPHLCNPKQYRPMVYPEFTKSEQYFRSYSEHPTYF